jgi:hypothetical protein
LLVVIAALGAACGHDVDLRWRPWMSRWYDDTSVVPPEPDRRYWTRRDEDLLQRRMGYADVAALGRLRLVNLESAFSSPQRLALAFEPLEVFYDDDLLEEQGGELVLVLKGGDTDFELAAMREAFLPGRRYLLLAKYKPLRVPGGGTGWRASLWRPDPAARKELHWVLYRPDPLLVQQVRTMYRWLEDK